MQESQHIEFKRHWKDDYLKWICAFANSSGGTLHIITEPYPYPVSYKGEYHYRSGSTKQELKGAALDKFLMRKHGITWDSVPVPYVKISDLDSKALTHFRRQAIRKQRLPEEILESWYQLRRAVP